MASSCKLVKHIPSLITILLMVAFMPLFPIFFSLSPARQYFQLLLWSRVNTHCSADTAFEKQNQKKALCCFW